MSAARDSVVVERRSSPRVAMEVEVSLTSEAYFYVGLTGDIRAGGVFIPTYQLRPVGAALDVDFKLPSGTARVRGRVRWVREAREGTASGLGVAFEKLDDGDRARIEELCRHRSPIYYEVEGH